MSINKGDGARATSEPLEHLDMAIQNIWPEILHSFLITTCTAGELLVLDIAKVLSKSNSPNDNGEWHSARRRVRCWYAPGQLQLERERDSILTDF